jgi:hypothetical protein
MNKNRKLMAIVAILCVIAGGGCASYNNNPLTPDGLNYTLSRDRVSGELVDYVGLTWNLKPEPRSK